LRVSATILRGRGASLALALLLGESSLAGLFLLLLSLPLPADIFELWIGKNNKLTNAPCTKFQARILMPHTFRGALVTMRLHRHMGIEMI
jgi:hypothetical protein